MVRNKVDLCMFCTDDEPCPSHAPKVKVTAKPRAPRKKAAAPITESNIGAIRSSQEGPEEKADVTAAMRAASKVKVQGSTIKEDHDAVDEITALLADPEWIAAIQAVGPLMHITERKRFESVLARVPDPRTRAAAWKARVK